MAALIPCDNCGWMCSETDVLCDMCGKPRRRPPSPPAELSAPRGAMNVGPGAQPEWSPPPTLPAVTQGTLRAGDGRALPLERTDVDAKIAGPVAEVIVRQRFKNDSATPIEAVYLFPLPPAAAVHRMEFRIADRLVRGVVKEKVEARRAYEQAKSEGRAATLLEEDRPAVFSLSVANVAPGATIEVELEYQEIVAFDDGLFRFVFPLVGPKRYADTDAPPAQPGALTPPRKPTGERSRDVGLTVVLREVAALDSVRCASHRTERSSLADGSLSLKIPEDAPLPNRDFVLTWSASEAGVRPRVYFERAVGAEEGTFLLQITPSAPREEGGGVGQDQLRALRCGNCGGIVTDMSAIRDIPGLGPVLACKYCGAMLAPGTETITRAVQPRDVVILVDRSASMLSSYSQARRAVLALLAALPLGDGVQVFAFDHDRAAFDGSGAGFLALSPEVIAQADSFLAAMGPRGGSEVSRALGCSAAIAPRPGRTRQVVLITDAAVGNDGLLLRKLPALLGPDARLYVLGVGESVDRGLVKRLARAGGGSHDVVLPDEDIEITLKRFARRVREGGPVLRDLGVFWEGAGLVDAHPSPVPDLFGGQPVQVLGRYRGVGPTRLVITGRTATDKPFRQEVDVELPQTSKQVPGLARVWARRHVEALAERCGREPYAGHDRRALALSLEHSIVGPYTSLVAEDVQVTVDKTRVRKLELVVEKGPDVGRRFVIGAPRVRIGQHASCDIVVTDSSVSRVHAEIFVEDGGYCYLDAASTNGSTLDGQAVRRGRLVPGVRLAMAGTEVRVREYDGPDAWMDVLPTKRVDLASTEQGYREEEGARIREAALRHIEPPPPPPPPVLPDYGVVPSWHDPMFPERTFAPPPALGAFGPPPAPGAFAPPPPPAGFAPPPPAPAAFAPPPPPALGAFGPPPPPPAPGFGRRPRRETTALRPRRPLDLARRPHRLRDLARHPRRELSVLRPRRPRHLAHRPRRGLTVLRPRRPRHLARHPRRETTALRPRRPLDLARRRRRLRDLGRRPRRGLTVLRPLPTVPLEPHRTVRIRRPTLPRPRPRRRSTRLLPHERTPRPPRRRLAPLTPR